MRRPCGTRPTPFSEIASGDRPEMDWPNRSTRVARALTSPMIALMQVVLPAPLRPSRPSTLAFLHAERQIVQDMAFAVNAFRPLIVSASVSKVHLPSLGIGDHFGAASFHHHSPRAASP